MNNKDCIKLLGQEGIERIIGMVATEFDIPPERVFQRTRKREVLDPYYAAFKLINDLMKLDPKVIMAIAGRDRTNYYHTSYASSNLYETDKDFKQKVNRIFNRITNEEIEKRNVQQRFLSNAQKRYRMYAISGRFDRQSSIGTIGRLRKPDRLRIGTRGQGGALLRDRRGTCLHKRSEGQAHSARFS